TKMLLNHRIEKPMGIRQDTDTKHSGSIHEPAPACASSDARTFAHSKVKGAGLNFGMAVSSALNRSALAPLIGWVESHSTRPSSFSASRSKNEIMPDGSTLARCSN